MIDVLPQIGLTTTILQAAATAVGAGIVLGGFLAGALGLVRGWDRRDIERTALLYGYVGGFGAVLLLIVDSAIHCLA